MHGNRAGKKDRNGLFSIKAVPMATRGLIIAEMKADKGPVIKYRGGGGVGYENFFFKFWFSVAHPRVIIYGQNWGGPPLEWHRKN